MNTNWNSRIHTISTSIPLKLYPSPWFLTSVFLVILFSLAFLWAAMSPAGQYTALSKSMLTGYLLSETMNGQMGDWMGYWNGLIFHSFQRQSPLKHILHTSARAILLNQRSRWVLSRLPVVYRTKSTFLSLAFKAIQREPLTHSLALSAPALALLKCSHPKISIPQPQTALVLQFLMATCSSCLAASCSRFVQLGTHICPFHPPWPKLQTLDLFPPGSPPKELCQTLVHPAGLTHFVFSTGHCTQNTG